MTITTINQPDQPAARGRSLEARRKEARKVVAKAATEAAQRGEEPNVVLIPSARAVPTVKAFALSIGLGTVESGWYGFDVPHPQKKRSRCAVIVAPHGRAYSPIRSGKRVGDILSPMLRSFGSVPINELDADACEAAYEAMGVAMGDDPQVQQVAAQLMGTIIAAAIDRKWIKYDPYVGAPSDAREV